MKKITSAEEFASYFKQIRKGKKIKIKDIATFADLSRYTVMGFENLLPEGDTLKELKKVRSKSLQGSYQFLKEYGADCAGALTITKAPNGKVDDASSRVNIPITELERTWEDRENIMVHTVTKYEARFSLAGAQDKIPIIYT